MFYVQSINSSMDVVDLVTSAGVYDTDLSQWILVFFYKKTLITRIMSNCLLNLLSSDTNIYVRDENMWSVRRGKKKKMKL